MHFSFIQNFLHVGFFLGPGDRIFVCLHDCAIPHNSRTIAVFYRTICLPKPAHFPFFFPHPVRRPAKMMSDVARALSHRKVKLIPPVIYLCYCKKQIDGSFLWSIRAVTNFSSRRVNEKSSRGTNFF